METGTMSDLEKVKQFLREYNSFLFGETNEIPPMEWEMPRDPVCREIVEILRSCAEKFKSRRNSDNILFGQLGLGRMVTETIKYFNRFITAMDRTVGEVHRLAEEVGRGDYTRRIGGEAWQGDVLQLVDAINTLLSEVNGMLAESYRNGLGMADAVRTLKRATGSLSSATTEQASALVETAGALEELTGGVESNTEQSRAMAALAGETKDAAHVGKELACETVNAVTEINGVAGEIGVVVKTIENIASQTNILSFNAAIEAARSGEHGKGFAVVATEVRKLAARSAGAAQQIRELAEAADFKSGSALEISQRMIRGFEEINDKIVRTEAIVTGVSGALDEQSVGISEINEAVRQLDRITQENSLSAEETDAVAGDVEAVAARLLAAAKSREFSGKERIPGL